MATALLKHARINTKKLNEIIECFAYELSAKIAARKVRVHRNTTTRIYSIIRTRIASACEKESILEEEIEVDESYFGGTRKGKRGRGAAEKVSIFGLLKRNGKVYTRAVRQVDRATLRLVIKQKVPEGSTIYSDSFRSYDGLITDGYHHYRINHQKVFTEKRNHINGIESFWSYAKTKLKKYYGIHRKNFPLFLKEMEFRFNHRNDDLLQIIKGLFAKHS